MTMETVMEDLYRECLRDQGQRPPGTETYKLDASLEGCREMGRKVEYSRYEARPDPLSQ